MEKKAKALFFVSLKRERERKRVGGLLLVKFVYKYKNIVLKIINKYLKII